MIALDAGILIYGVQHAALAINSPGSTGHDFETIRRASALMAELTIGNKVILLPAPAAWEYVLDFAVAEQPLIWNSFEGFAVAPFDPAAARIAARIARKHYETSVQNQRGKGKKVVRQTGARQMEKVDMLILAVAIAQRAEKIYTIEVDQFRAWSDGMIEVAGLPSMPRRLFDPGNPP